MVRRSIRFKRRGTMALVAALVLIGAVLVGFALVHGQDPFGIIYRPAPARTPEKLIRSMESLPPPVEGPALSLSEAQSYVDFEILTLSPAVKLEKVYLKKEKRVDSPWESLPWVYLIYDIDGVSVTVVEHHLEPGSGVGRPEEAESIAVQGGEGWLLTVTEGPYQGESVVNWRRDDLLVVMYGVLPPEELLELLESLY